MRASSRTPYLGPEVRRPFVLEAALDLFASAGYAGTSMSRVAKRSGISKAVVYDCFPGGKAEIFDALGVLAPHPEGLLLRGSTDDLDWLARIFARFPFEFQILQPAELRAAVRRRAETLLEQVAEPGAD